MKTCTMNDCKRVGQPQYHGSYCISCGSKLEDMATCSGCSQPLEQAQQRFCGYCGAEVLKKG